MKQSPISPSFTARSKGSAGLLLWVVLFIVLGAFKCTSLPFRFSTSLVQSHGISPKVFIITMFIPEQEAWNSKIDFPHHITVPGLSLLFPQVHCVQDYSICHMTTGEGEINASNSMMALLLNPQFDLSRTYFLLNGIGGGEPSRVTTGSVTFAKYAIQVGLMYQIDSRELPVAYKDWPSGYFSYGAKDPFTYPDAVYGTEIYELNEHLRDRAIRAAKKNEASLQSGTPQNILLRNMYDGPGGEPPTVMACDVTTSDNYFFGHRMSDFFMDYTSMVTNNTAYYCSSAQEENGTLESLLRMAKSHRVSFDRIIVMRSISNFVKPPPSVDDSVDFFNNFNKGGFQLALDNLFLGGYPVVEDIVENWDEVYAEGVKCSNYVGDIFGSLGGTPNFGKHNYTIH